MSANSKEWKDGTLREIADHLVEVSAMIYRHLNKPETQTSRYTVLDHSIYSLNKTFTDMINIQRNYFKRPVDSDL